MRTHIPALVAVAGIISIGGATVLAQQSPVLTAILDSQTPAAQSLPVGAQDYDAARITLSASDGDVFISGIVMGTDMPGGLSNFSSMRLYDVTHAPVQLGVYPSQTERPDLIELTSPIIIGSGMSKTYLLRVSLSSSAAGAIRVGFAGFTYATIEVPALSGVPIYGNTLTLPGATPTPTATLTPTPTPQGFVNLAALGLSEGNTISATGSADPDIYIVNDWGYKRLFLNPVIFGFYSHLGGFANVKTVTSQTRDVLKTSGLFRNCETNDAKVYGVETTGEDTGTLHWVNTTGAQAVQDDPDFFKKVFCVNSNEFNWYGKGSEYTSVNQVPAYNR